MLFYQTVHAINRKDYTHKQLDVWAPAHPNLAVWHASLKANHTLLAIQDGLLIGFGDIEPSGYFNRLFVHHAHQRKGIATALCDRLEPCAQGRRITVHASITAKPFFEHRDYVTLRQQQVARGKTLFINYLMEKRQTPKTQTRL